MFFFLTGVLLLPEEDLAEVYDGLWGYNAVIATASITCVFFAFNTMSFLLGMANLGANVCAQYALRATITLKVFFPPLDFAKEKKKNESIYSQKKTCFTGKYTSKYVDEIFRALRV